VEYDSVCNWNWYVVHWAVLQTYLKRRVSMSRSLYVEMCTACCVGQRRKCFLVVAIIFCINRKWFCKSYSAKTVTNWSQLCCGIWIPSPVWIRWNHFGPIRENSFLISRCKLEICFQNSLTFRRTKSLDQFGFDWTLSFSWSISKVCYLFCFWAFPFLGALAHYSELLVAGRWLPRPNLT
jgi:hypothetical protein